MRLCELIGQTAPTAFGEVRGPIVRSAAVAAACVCVLGTLGCQNASPPPTKVEYKTQHQLLQKAMTRLEDSSGQKDVETLTLLKQLEAELAEAQTRHLAAQREIARLRREVGDLRAAAGFAVARIEIRFFTHADENGIELGVAPFDRHDDVVKTAGVFEVSLHHRGGMLEKLGAKICMWQLSANEVEKLWKGELYQGYELKLRWPDGKVPDVQNAVLNVAFTTPEGKTFTDTKELTLARKTQ